MTARGGRPWNPVWIHPDDMREIGVSEGQMVRIATSHDSIAAMVEEDATLRTDEDYDPITGMPRMGNIPVAITRC